MLSTSPSVNCSRGAWTACRSSRRTIAEVGTCASAAQLSVELAVDAQVQGDVDRCRSLRDLGQGGLCVLSTLGADSVV